MAPTTFSSSLKNENNTNVTKNLKNIFLCSPKKNLQVSCQQRPQEKQNYFPFRSAAYQRSQRCPELEFISIVAQTNIFYLLPTGLYLQKKEDMRSRSTVQEYCRYRDAQYRESATTSVLSNANLYVPSYLEATKRNENDYSRYRSANTPRERPASKMNRSAKIHFKCRTLVYDKEAQRFPVPDNKVPWNIEFIEYEPVEYTTAKVLKNPKADSPDPSKITKFNQLDNKIDRRSFTGFYCIDSITCRPRNPIGRTGMTGRGRLYHWGPNHAGDPVVTRWKREQDGSVVYCRLNAHDQLKPVLEFVAIRRRDTQQWALPGGMADPGEDVAETVKREFREEALRDGLDETNIKRLFSNGYKLFESYVDDPRNTDNAWMESVAIHFHDDTGLLTENLNLHAGDDADKVVWCEINRTLDLYATHKDFIKAAVDRLDAYW